MLTSRPRRRIASSRTIDQFGPAFDLGVFGVDDVPVWRSAGHDARYSTGRRPECCYGQSQKNRPGMMGAWQNTTESFAGADPESRRRAPPQPAPDESGRARLPARCGATVIFGLPMGPVAGRSAWRWGTSGRQPASMVSQPDWFAIRTVPSSSGLEEIPAPRSSSARRINSARGWATSFGENFLSAEVVGTNAARCRVANRLGTWLSEPDHAGAGGQRDRDRAARRHSASTTGTSSRPSTRRSSNGSPNRNRVRRWAGCCPSWRRTVEALIQLLCDRAFSGRSTPGHHRAGGAARLAQLVAEFVDQLVGDRITAS